MNIHNLVALLTARNETVATCESLTAGLVAATIADIPGASVVLRGGLVTYATELKVTLAGLSEEVVGRGVVTEAVARAMAEGARSRCGSTWGIATTGVAGPGSSDGIPAGTAWVAVAGPVTAAEYIQVGDIGRPLVRKRCVDAVLTLLQKSLA